MNLRFIDDNRYPLFFTLAVIFAVISWFGTSLPPQSMAVTLPAESWQLPQLAERSAPKSIAAINARNLWGATVTAVTTKEPEWRVVGIATAGTERFVLLAYEGKPIASLRVGDTLPDETKIVQIDSDRFFVQAKNKKKLVFGLYKNEQAQ